MSGSMSAWLAGRAPAELAEILRLRPDVAARRPRDLGQLANLLNQPASTSQALADLDVFCLQLLAGLQVLGDPAPRTGLDGLVAGRADPAEVDAALARLSARALAWPDGDRVRLAGGARHCWDLPAGLGRPARQLLATLTLADLDVVARRHGARPERPKAALVEQVARLLDDADRVRALLDRAPAAARELLSPLVDPGARLTIYNPRVTSTGVRTPVGWLLAHGLLVPADYTTAEVPREVALALRGGRVLLEVAAGPPELPPHPVETSAAGPRAADALLAAVQAVAAEVDARPPAQLKDGGLGVRELRRLAVAAGVEERTGRAVLELLATAGLLTPTRDDVLLTREYDAWADRPPARRWATLAAAWLGCPYALVPPDLKRPALVPLWVRGLSEGMRTLRDDLLGVLADLPDGAGADPRDLAVRLAWSRPLRYGTNRDALRRAVADTLAEAELLGIAVGGALTPAGRAALLEGPDAAADLLAPQLAGAATTVTLQTDLTAIVAGPPAAPLATLLDRVADRESRDTASVWRFSPSSVRRALDAGTRADALLGELAAAAAGTVPQALTYLVHDVARAHGRLRVGTAGCYLRSDDPALAAEVLRARKLAGLRLRPLAPTVLASAAGADETLAKLRAAGYAPVREDRDGDLVLARAGRRRAAPAARRATAGGPQPATDAPPAVDPADLARRLLSGQPPPSVPARRPGNDGLPLPGDDPLPFPGYDPDPDGFPEGDPPAAGATDGELLARYGGQLDPHERGVLLAAIRTGRPVRIGYVDGAGRPTERVLEDLDLDGPYLAGWCRLRADERTFALGRVLRVQPA